MPRALSLVLPFALALAACGEERRPATITPDADTPDTPAATDAPSPSDARPLDDGAASACGACEAYGAVRAAGEVRAAGLDEISGLGASRVHPGVWYVHNDSGDSARFFALDAAGSVRGELRPIGARNVDWEDLAVGPCPAGSCVYLADIGDNDRARRSYTIYRVAEPASFPASPATVVDVAAEALSFVYPDGAHDAEALFVHPALGEIYVLTKTPGRTGVYRFPTTPPADGPAMLTRVAEVSIPSGVLRLVTGADVHPCAARVLLRTYDRVLELRGAPGAPFADVFGATPVELPAPTEMQGEAIAWRADGRGYATLSERGAAPTVAFNTVDCR